MVLDLSRNGMGSLGVAAVADGLFNAATRNELGGGLSPITTLRLAGNTELGATV